MLQGTNWPLRKVQGAPDHNCVKKIRQIDGNSSVVAHGFHALLPSLRHSVALLRRRLEYDSQGRLNGVLGKLTEKRTLRVKYGPDALEVG